MSAAQETQLDDPNGIPEADRYDPDALKKATAPPRKRRITAWIGSMILIFWILIALIGPYVAPHNEADMIADEEFTAMGVDGILGTDYIGRDVLSRVLYGARMTLGLALIASLMAFTLGSILGLLAAVAGGWLDNLLSRINDAIMAFPSIMLALIIIGSLGTSMVIVIFTVAVLDATRVFRLARALGMDLSVMDFVEVAVARGENRWWIITREILPNTLAPLAAEFGLRFTGAILFISALSFLGLGVQPPQADWGVMVRENIIGLSYGATAALIPAAAIASLTIGVNFLVDAMMEHANKDISEELI